MYLAWLCFMKMMLVTHVGHAIHDQIDIGAKRTTMEYFKEYGPLPQYTMRQFSAKISFRCIDDRSSHDVYLKEWKPTPKAKFLQNAVSKFQKTRRKIPTKDCGVISDANLEVRAQEPLLAASIDRAATCEGNVVPNSWRDSLVARDYGRSCDRTHER
jgi:hypothetical protein